MIVKELLAKIGLEVDEEGFAKVEELWHGLFKGAAAAGLGVVALVGTFLELGRETANAGFEIQKAATRMGITTDAVQELQFAAEETGVSFEALQSMMFKMERASYAAQHGATAAADGFKGILSLKELKEGGTPDELLMKMVEGLEKIKNPAERAAKLTAVFGKGAQELLPLLDKGAEGIQEFRDEIHELGGVLSADAIEDSKQYRKELGRFEAQMTGLKYSIGSGALKAILAFGKGMRAMTRSVKEFFGAHLGLIFGSLALAAGIFAAQMVVAGIAAVGAAAVAAGGLGALVSQWVFGSVVMAHGWLVAFWPIALAVVLIGLVILILEDLYEWATGGESIFKDLWGSIGDGAQLLWDKIKEFWTWLDTKFFQPFSTWLWKLENEGFKRLMDGWKKVANFIQHPLSATFGGGDSGDAPAVGGFSGGATSPTASVGASPAGGTKIIAPQNTFHTTVTSHPGMNEADIADAVTRKITEHMDKENRELIANAP